jgi:hypothetical protein
MAGESQIIALCKRRSQIQLTYLSQHQSRPNAAELAYRAEAHDDDFSLAGGSHTNLDMEIFDPVSC